MGGALPTTHHPCLNKNSSSKHTPNGWLTGRVLLRATSCVCVCVLLGVCSSNKGKRCVPHCLSRWLCSALSACLISASVSVSPAVVVNGLEPLDHLEKNLFRKDIICIFWFSPCKKCVWVLRRVRKCLFVYLTSCKVCVHVCVDIREKECMVLPTPLEMLGCPAWLFLDQWQRVNGCRCVAKEGSEIPTDPGRSLPHLPLPVCLLSIILSFKMSFHSPHIMSL